MTTHVPFFLSPLINVERLTLDWREALGRRPRWALNMIEVGEPEDVADADAASAGLAITVGGKHPLTMQLPPAAAAPLFELTRFSGRVVTNSNGSDPFPQVYAKLLYGHAPHDATPVMRLLYGASSGERVKALTHPRDHDPANAYAEPDVHAKKHARMLNIAHAELTARERAPAGFDIGGYVQNMRDLFAYLDAIRGVEG